MICLICRQAEIIAGRTTVAFNRGEIRLVITNVPARVCPSCREAYVDGEVTARLLAETQELSQAGMFEVERDYTGAKD